METPVITTKQDIYYERLLVSSGIKKCNHKHTIEDYCMVCKRTFQ